MKRENMKIRKTISIILAAFLFTGIAAADTPDIPSPGLTPESPFYILEKASERLELAVARAPVIGSEELEAKVRANHAAETLAEARVMAEKNNTAQVEKLMNRYSENMNRSIESASSTNETELKQRLRNITDNQNNALAELENKVPEQAQKGIKNAMENNRKNRAQLSKPPVDTPAGPDPGKRETPKQGRDEESTGKGTAPITGRSTAPEKPSTEPSSDREPRKPQNSNDSNESSAEKETREGERSETGNPVSDMEKQSSEPSGEPGNSGRP